jgi:hypothetical protein
MTGPRSAAKLVLGAAVAMLVVSIVGFITTLLLHIFVWDEFDAYGEVPIPGSASLELPQGEVTISFHTQIIGSGGALPVPPISVGIVAPDGVAEPELTEDIGATTTVNNDARIQVWVAQIPEAGSYDITTDGQVGAFVSPRLAFGHGSSLGWLPVVFGVAMGVSILDLVIALFWVTHAKTKPDAPVGLQDFPGFSDQDADLHDEVRDAPVSYEPTETGIRIQQLKTLAALRDSGALTEDEFEEEKRRLLDGR